MPRFVCSKCKFGATVFPTVFPRVFRWSVDRLRISGSWLGKVRPRLGKVRPRLDYGRTCILMMVLIMLSACGSDSTSSGGAIENSVAPPSAGPTEGPSNAEPSKTEVFLGTLASALNPASSPSNRLTYRGGAEAFRPEQVEIDSSFEVTLSLKDKEISLQYTDPTHHGKSPKFTWTLNLATEPLSSGAYRFNLKPHASEANSANPAVGLALPKADSLEFMIIGSAPDYFLWGSRQNFNFNDEWQAYDAASFSTTGQPTPGGWSTTFKDKKIVFGSDQANSDKVASYGTYRIGNAGVPEPHSDARFQISMKLSDSSFGEAKRYLGNYTLDSWFMSDLFNSSKPQGIFIEPREKTQIGESTSIFDINLNTNIYTTHGYITAKVFKREQQENAYFLAGRYSFRYEPNYQYRGLFILFQQ